MACPWCLNATAADDIDPESLCRAHEAEWEGLPLSELDRRDHEQSAEYDEWVLGH